MAEGLLRHICKGEYEVYSAGTKKSFVRPEAIKAMTEIGIDISKQHSKSVEEFADMEMNYVLTVCDNARETCPIFPAKTKRFHHSFEDPAAVIGGEKTRLDAFRKVRDEIADFLRKFAHELEN
jgi:arsenate reductase